MKDAIEKLKKDLNDITEDTVKKIEREQSLLATTLLFMGALATSATMAATFGYGAYILYKNNPQPAIIQKADYQKPVVMNHPEGLVFKVGDKYFLDKNKDKTLDEMVVLKNSKTGEKEILKKGDIRFENYETEFKEQVLPNVKY